MPAVRGGGDRIADPTEGARLIDALNGRNRALWAVRHVRRSATWRDRALRHGCIDLAAGVIRVEQRLGRRSGGRSRRRTAGPARCRSPTCCATTWRASRGLLTPWRSVRRPWEPFDPKRPHRTRWTRRGRTPALDEDHAARMQALLRLADDRRGHEREGAGSTYITTNIAITLEEVRASVPRQRGRGGGPAQHLPGPVRSGL